MNLRLLVPAKAESNICTTMAILYLDLRDWEVGYILLMLMAVTCHCHTLSSLRTYHITMFPLVIWQSTSTPVSSGTNTIWCWARLTWFKTGLKSTDKSDQVVAGASLLFMQYFWKCFWTSFHKFCIFSSKCGKKLSEIIVLDCHKTFNVGSFSI